MKNSKLAAIRPGKRASILRRPEDSEIMTALNEACRQDFMSFVSLCFAQLMPGTALLLNWHVEAIAFRLNEVRRGTIKKLMINAPPRYGKSFLTSVLLPAYLLGLDPTKRIIVVCYGSELAVKLANDFRAIVNSAWYKSLFPHTEISRTKNSEHEVVTTQGGYRLATSIDGALTGRGCDLLIIDDPLKPSDAFSSSKRERVNNQFRNTLFSRLDDKKNGAIIIVMQRLHVDDLCGELLKETDDWSVLRLAAVAEKDERIQIGEGRYHQRQEGEPLNPKVEDTSDLDAVRLQVGSDIFAAQYLQRPVPPEGAMIKKGWVNRYDQLPIRNASSYVSQSWDTAVKSGGEHDFSVCVTTLVQDHNYYVIDVLRERIDYPTLRERAKSLAQKYSPNQILIEDSGVGSALVTELKNAGLAAVAIRPDGDKLTRLSV